VHADAATIPPIQAQGLVKMFERII